MDPVIAVSSSPPSPAQGPNGSIHLGPHEPAGAALRRRLFLVGAAAAALSVGLSLAVFEPQREGEDVTFSLGGSASEAGALVGTAFTQPLTLQGGDVLTTTAADDAGPTVLVFWAPWCGACKEQSATLRELDAAGELRDARFLAVNIESDDPEAITRVRWPKAMRHALNAQASGLLSEQLHVEAIPRTLVIRDGAVTADLLGAREPEQLRELFSAKRPGAGSPQQGDHAAMSANTPPTPDHPEAH